MENVSEDTNENKGKSPEKLLEEARERSVEHASSAESETEIAAREQREKLLQKDFHQIEGSPAESIVDGPEPEKEAAPKKLKVYLNKKAEYYAAEEPEDKGDSHIPFPTKALLAQLSARPGEKADLLTVREEMAQHGNGEKSLYKDNTGIVL